jgi:hypothetical protein
MVAPYESSADPLLHTRLRLARARKKFTALGRDAGEFVPKNQVLDRRFDRSSGWTSYHLSVRRSPPKQLSESVGSVCEDLRTSLDLLVGALKQGRESDFEPSRFPICLTSDAYLGIDGEPGERQRSLSGLDSPDVSLIDSLQPYHRVDPAKDPLSQLQSLFDFHTRKKLRCAVIVDGRPGANFEEMRRGSVTSSDMRRCRPGVTAETGLEIMAYRVMPDPEARLKVDINVSFNIRIDPLGITMSDLDRIRLRVEAIVRGFDTRLRVAA